MPRTTYGPFVITEENFSLTNKFDSYDYYSNWPVIYIITNGSEVYIGETTNLAQRMYQHLKSPSKLTFRRVKSRVYIIYSNTFNQSITFDYEHKLIQYISSDDVFSKTHNLSPGLSSDVRFYGKSVSDKKFVILWNALRREGIANNSLRYLRNSDFFKYSPYKRLNADQQNALNDIILKLHSPGFAGPIIVNGAPGSGKSILGVFLFKYLKDYEYPKGSGNYPYRAKKMALLLPKTALRKTIEKLFSYIDGLSKTDVIGPTGIQHHKYDIIIVDEAHCLHQRKNKQGLGQHDTITKKLGLQKDATELDWIFAQTQIPILLYDAHQVIGPSGIDRPLLDSKIASYYPGIHPTEFTLKTQMRVAGGNDYLQYIDDVLWDRSPAKTTFDPYEFKIIQSFKNFRKLMLNKASSDGLSLMAAGYAWPWISKRVKGYKDIKIEGIALPWNGQVINWINTPNAINEVGCIHSLQGYDLNYAFIILGPDIGYDVSTGKIIIHSDRYFDRNGKNTATEAELDIYIRNIYYTLLTRGIKGTYIYVCDPDLETHLLNYIDVL